jgi:hypothetical protein
LVILAIDKNGKTCKYYRVQNYPSLGAVLAPGLVTKKEKTMVHKKMWLGILVLAFGMAVVGCDDGSKDDGNNVAKTLIIQNIPTEMYSYGRTSGSQLGIFSVGTNPQQALSLTNIVAGAYLSNTDITVSGTGPYSMILPLYNISGNDRWMGSGTYDVYVMLRGGGGHYYKADSVNISSGTTTISFNTAIKVSPHNSTINISDIPENVYAYLSNGGYVGIYPVGTTLQQALNQTDFVAGANIRNPDIYIISSGGLYTLTMPLYNISATAPWIGDGTYDVYLLLSGGHYFKASSVNISSMIAIISFGNIQEVFLTN